MCRLKQTANHKNQFKCDSPLDEAFLLDGLYHHHAHLA